MPLHPLEEATLQTFVVPSKRDRLLTLLGNPGRRSHALDLLNHFAHWDARFARPVESSADVLALLVRFGAPSQCHLISDSSELDGREMLLAEAVPACEDFEFASVLCCLPGELAFYFDEMAAPRVRVLLRRQG